MNGIASVQCDIRSIPYYTLQSPKFSCIPRSDYELADSLVKASLACLNLEIYVLNFMNERRSFGA